MQELTQNAIEAEKDFNVKQRLWTEENSVLQSRNRALAQERDKMDKELSDAIDQLCASFQLHSWPSAVPSLCYVQVQSVVNSKIGRSYVEAVRAHLVVGMCIRVLLKRTGSPQLQNMPQAQGNLASIS